MSVILAYVLAGLFLELMELSEARVFEWRRRHGFHVRGRLDLHCVLLSFANWCIFRGSRL